MTNTKTKTATPTAMFLPPATFTDRLGEVQSTPPIQLFKSDSGDELFYLCEDIIEKVTDDISITINKGYVSDGASVPRFFWRLLSPKINVTTLVPSLVHDRLYETQVVSREQADIYYYNALRRNGYPWWKSALTFWGLRLFGHSHWEK